MKTSVKANMHIMSTGLPQPRLARSAHRGRIKLLRGYVSKSHDHAASLASVPGLARSVRVLIKCMWKHSKLAQGRPGMIHHVRVGQ